MTFQKLDARKLGIAAMMLAGLSGCTSSMEDAARQELKANPSAAAALAKAADATIPVETASAEPAPIIPGTNTPAPLPAFKAVALAAPGAAPTASQAEAVMVAQQQAALRTPAMPNAASPAAVTTLAVAGVDPDAEDIPAEATIVQTAVPVRRPGSTSTALAYASPSTAASSFAVMENSYDVTPPGAPPTAASLEPPATTGPTVINGLIRKYSALYEIPEALVHRVVHRESRYNPAAFNRGHYGLMQIKYATAKSMGYEGPASGLFDAESNLKYSIKYLKGAWLVADKSNDNAVRLYARGYYYDAKRRGMLHVLQ